jgi:PTH2 family peptidyl-tRNA hydrolase
VDSVYDPSALKMVLVVRGELGLSPGKAAVQVAHGAVMLVLEGKARKDRDLERWLSEGQKKVALRARSLVEMEELRKKAASMGLRTVFVQDAGLTEVPAGTKTVLGIGPGSPSDIDKVTGSLPLL